MPQELPVEDKLSKLLEFTELYIEITNQGFQIQALDREKSSEDEREIGVGTEEPSASCSRPRKEKLQDCVETEGLDRVVHTELGSAKSQNNTPAKPVIISEIKCNSIQQTTIYKGRERKLSLVAAQFFVTKFGQCKNCGY